MGEPPKRRATYDDLRDVPDHLLGELLDGTLYTSQRPGAAHANASIQLARDLVGPFNRGRGGPGGWVILGEPELHLSGDALVPDLAGWRRERMPVVPDVAAITLAPDWICEVLSPQSTETRDRREKMPIYAREGVSHLWLVNAITKTLEAYALNGEKWLLLGTWAGDERVRGKPFDAIELDLAVLWSR